MVGRQRTYKWLLGIVRYGEQLLMGTYDSSGSDENILGLDGIDGGTSLN